VVAVFSKADPTKTLWVVARGTTTLHDMMADLDITDYATISIGGLPLPKKMTERVKNNIKLLSNIIKRTGAEQINFCGHSLGGAVAGCFFYIYNAEENSALKTKLFTVNSPQLLRSIPEFLVCANKKIEMAVLATQVHNIVQRLDIVARAQGPNTLPSYVYWIPNIGMKIHQMERSMAFQKRKRGGPARDGFLCFGIYYSLNPSHSGRSSTELKIVDGPQLISVFSSDVKGFTAAIAVDHNSETVASTLMELCPAYKSQFSWGEYGKVVKKPSMEKYQPLKGKEALVSKYVVVKAKKRSMVNYNISKKSSLTIIHHYQIYKAFKGLCVSLFFCLDTFFEYFFYVTEGGLQDDIQIRYLGMPPSDKGFDTPRDYKR